MSNRSELAAAIASDLNTTKKVGDEVLLVVVKALQAQLEAKGEAVLPGFGRLRLHDRAARKGHNPKTGAPIDIPAKTVVKFKKFNGRETSAE